MIPWYEAGALALAAAAVCFLAFLIAGLLDRSGPIRLRRWSQEQGGRLLALYARAGRFEAFRFVLSIGARAAPFLVFGVIWILLAGRGSRHPLGWATGAAVGAAAIAELAARRVLARRAEKALSILGSLYGALAFLFHPLLVLLAPVIQSRTGAQRLGEDAASDEEIEAFLDVGTREGIFEPEEEDLVWRIVDFGDTQVKSVMTPRIDVVAVAAEVGVDELAREFLSAKHARIPVFQGTIDQIMGVVHIRDVLQALRSGQDATARELAHRPYFVPETKPVDELLQEFQRRHQQLAIAVDEYGGTAGLVTVEDVVEELVGEIFDEHEPALDEPHALGDGKWQLDGRAHLAELEDLTGVKLEDLPYETVGGLVFGLVGDVPKPGHSVSARGLRFTVESVADRRIESVIIERVRGEGEEQAEAGAPQ